MISTIAALAILQVPGEANLAPSPKDLLAKMIANYSSAGSLRGMITMNQKAQGKSVVVETGIQVEKPLRVYLHQIRKDTGEDCLLTSDGREFSFPIESQLLKLRRHVEPLYDANGKVILNSTTKQPFGLPDMYVAMNAALVDKNIWLDMIFGERSHLEAMRAKWATLAYRGRVKVKGAEVHAIAGHWRETALKPPTGDFEIYLDDDHNLVRYVINERFAVPSAGQTIEVSTIWDSTVKIGAEVDPSFFKVAR